MTNSLLHIGIRGTVIALDRATGEEVWNVSLKGADFVTVVLDDGALYAASKGEIYCLDPASGQIRWHNPLKGYGWGLISIASAGDGQAVLMREKKRRDDQESAASTTATT